ERHAAPAPAAGSGPVALTSAEQKLLAAFDTYLRVVPDAPEAANILYRKARLFYDKGQYDRAAPLFAELIEKYPDHELAIYAVNLYLDSLNAQHKAGEVCDAVARFGKAGPATRDPELAAQLEGLRRDCEKRARKAGEK